MLSSEKSLLKTWKTIFCSKLFSNIDIIVTNNCTIYDYIEDGKTGLILANEKKLWIEAIKKIYNDSDFYDMLSKNEIYSFKHDFSLKSLGEKVGSIV